MNMTTITIPNPQLVHGRSVNIVTKPNGRFAIISGHAYPLALCAITAGKDAWMHDIQCACGDCNNVFSIRQLNEGFYCEACVDKSIEECS